MPRQNQVEATIVPSVTTWTRLEPITRDALMQRSLQAQVRDPLWFLARQYQMGEFLGDDGGSPLHASVLAEFRNVTTYRPGNDDAMTEPIDQPRPGQTLPVLPVPVETHVERESVTLRLRGTVQFGRYFENLVRNSTISQPESVIKEFRDCFPILPEIPDPLLASPDAKLLRYSVAGTRDTTNKLQTGRVVNGVDLYAAAFAIQNGKSLSEVLAPQCNVPGIGPVLQDFAQYWQSVFSEPVGDSAWQPPKMHYDFALGSPTSDQNLLLAANDFGGGRLDWYSFSLQSAPQNPVSTSNPATITTQAFDLLPNHVVFRGMPDPRWWNFEDAATDFGQLDPQHVDLPKLLVMEFALIFGNDWFTVPIPVPLGTPTSTQPVQAALSRITSLVVTDSFGVRTLILPAEQTTVTPGAAAWSMFKLSEKDTRSDFILMAPTLGGVQDAGIMEEVLFVRDDMAAMAWAIEKQLQGDLDSSVDPQQTYLQMIEGKKDPAPTYTPGGPDVYYSVEKIPPYNWVPLVPVLSKQKSPYLRRGVLEIPDPTSSTGVKPFPAHAAILQPPPLHLFVVDHAVPRAGLLVDRYFRFARSFFGTSFLWLARKSQVGRGQGWSGLRFDLVRDIPKT
jgi:hypothetical protein